MPMLRATFICMAFDYNSPAELFIPKRKGFSGQRSGQIIAGSPPQRRLSASQSRNFPPSEHSVLGCRSETSALGAMKFVSYMRVAIIRFSAPCPVKTKRVG
jgi:hypothetical protein